MGGGIAADKILVKIEHELGPSEQTITAKKNRRREREQEQKQRIQARREQEQARREQEQLSKARREQEGRKRTGAPFKGISFFLGWPPLFYYMLALLVTMLIAPMF